MTEALPLSRSAAILLGASEWEKYPAFESHEGFLGSANFLRKYFIENGVVDSNILWLFNSEEAPSTIIGKIQDFIGNKIPSDIENIIVYYVGHGVFYENSFHVALRSTDKNNPDVSSLRIKYLAKTLSQFSSNKRQIIIIDACYAAGAVKEFIYQGDGSVASHVVSELRVSLPSSEAKSGTCIFCASGPRAKARAEVGAEFTIFSGALRDVLMTGSASVSNALLSLEDIAEAVESRIAERYASEGPRPELHTPKQDRGKIGSVPLFPNPAWQKNPEIRLQAALTDLEDARGKLALLGHEVAWLEASRTEGWYGLSEQVKKLDHFGELSSRHRIVNIHDPASHRILEIPYGFSASLDLGTCIIEEIVVDEGGGRSIKKKDLPSAAPRVSGTVPLSKAKTHGIPHKGVSISARSINAFAMTSRGARLRQHPEEEAVAIGCRIPTRRLRVALTFPSGYAPAGPLQTVAHLQGGANLAIKDLPVDDAETERISECTYYDRTAGVLVFDVDRALPRFRYRISWTLPPPPPSKFPELEVRAKEQIRHMLEMSAADKERMRAKLRKVRNKICQAHLDLPSKRANSVLLSLLAFNEADANWRIICSTAEVPDDKFGLPWGVGVAGWVEGRRRPIFVDTVDPDSVGIYKVVEGSPKERHVLAVPIPLPSSETELRQELLSDLAVPCIIAVLSCLDERGNLERLKASGEILNAVSGAVALEIFEVTRLGLKS